MSLDSDIKRIIKMGGHVQIDGHDVGSADEFRATLKAIELNQPWDVERMAALDLWSLAKVVKTNESLPANAKPKGYPKGYRPTLNIRPNHPNPFYLRWL
ncbi:MAG: hypothetical protein R3C01_06215 [Planctomycetaceae bacterium]